VSKHKPLSTVQLGNIKALITELERSSQLEEFRIEVQEFFDRHPTRECRDIVPVAMEALLHKFARIMDGER
jgi:hypothetical protein